MARGATSILHHAKSVRRQPTFSPLDKSRRVFLFAFVSLVVLASACAIFYIGTHIQAVNLGYKIGQELQRKEQLIEENKRLSLEIARLKSPTRIESEAKETLGLELPKTQQVFYLSRWEPDTLTQVAGVGPAPKNPEAKEAAKKPDPNKSLAVASPEAKPKPAAKTASLAPASIERKSPTAEQKTSEPKTASPAEAKLAAKSLAVKPARKAVAPEPDKVTPIKAAKSDKAAPELAAAKNSEVKSPSKKPSPVAKTGEAPQLAKSEPTAKESTQAKPAKALERPATPEKSATLAKKSEPSRPESVKPEAKPPAAKSSAKPGPRDTRFAKGDGSEVLVAKIVAKESSREKNVVKPRGAAASTYQTKDKVPAVMLDPMP
ncbi:MAG: cell division protein FtsL [Deltaproteobacteria bacterium]|nr:cell division protein FtsL [Deltaproteobacteria bacterium]